MTNERPDGFCVACSVGQTPDKGRGVFAGEPVAKGRIVWRFTQGCYTVHDEAGFKAVIAGLSSADVVHALNHVFGLAEFPGCLVRITDDGALINHDATPNLATNFAVPASHRLDPDAPDYVRKVADALRDDRFCLIATRDIAAGEEFTNDYTAEVSDPPFYHALCERYGVDEDYLGQT